MNSRVKRVLVVDDDADVATVTAQSLILFGAADEVKVAASGEAAWRRMSTEFFDLVIADLNMPGMDGLALLGKIRSDHPGVQLVLMTGDDNAETERSAHQLGVHHLLPKPFLPELLVDTVRTLLVEPSAPDNGVHRQKHVGPNLQSRN